MAEVGKVETVVEPPTPVEPKETAKDFYAWTEIKYGAEVDENGHILKTHSVNYGDKVTQKGMGLDDEAWQRLVDGRSVRKSVPPTVGRYESPKRKLINEAARQMEIAQAGGE